MKSLLHPRAITTASRVQGTSRQQKKAGVCWAKMGRDRQLSGEPRAAIVSTGHAYTDGWHINLRPRLSSCCPPLSPPHPPPAAAARRHAQVASRLAQVGAARGVAAGRRLHDSGGSNQGLLVGARVGGGRVQDVLLLRSLLASPPSLQLRSVAEHHSPFPSLVRHPPCLRCRSQAASPPKRQSSLWQQRNPWDSSTSPARGLPLERWVGAGLVERHSNTDPALASSRVLISNQGGETGFGPPKKSREAALHVLRAVVWEGCAGKRRSPWLGCISPACRPARRPGGAATAASPLPRAGPPVPRTVTPLPPSLPPQAYRDNHRVQFSDPAFADSLWRTSGLAEAVGQLEDEGGTAVGLNPNIRCAAPAAPPHTHCIALLHRPHCSPLSMQTRCRGRAVDIRGSRGRLAASRRARHHVAPAPVLPSPCPAAERRKNTPLGVD